MAGGSAELARDTQRFFTAPVAMHGWRTDDLRRSARACQKEILAQGGPELLLGIADELFQRGAIHEDKHFAVMLLQDRVRRFGAREFARFVRWLDAVENWSEHDALVHYLIGPLLLAEPKRRRRVVAWAKSANRWRRRAAAVALVRAARARQGAAEIARVARLLARDPDDMVQKGLGWLLRERAKADAAGSLPLLLALRGKTSALVLRTACETLPPKMRTVVLGR